MVYIGHGPTELEDSLPSRVEQLQPVLHRYCLALTKSQEDAEDLVQDTLVKALRANPGLTHFNPEALLLRIAKNTWIDSIRRRTHLHRIMEQSKPELQVCQDHSRLEIEAAFQVLMQHLSPLQRTVFLLREILGYSITEASHIMKTSEGAVKAALHRARLALAGVHESLGDPSVVSAEDQIAREHIEQLATAYLDGEIGMLIQLIQKNQMASIATLTQVQHQMMKKSTAIQAGKARSYPTMMYAA